MTEKNDIVNDLKSRIKGLEKENDELKRTNRVVTELARNRFNSINDLEIQALTLKDMLTEQQH